MAVDAGLLAIIGASDFEPFAGLPTKQEERTRREWRIKQDTGELRGVIFRERNKERKTAGWINRHSPAWGEICQQFSEWQRAARYAVGTFEQRAFEHDQQPTGSNIRESTN